MLAPDRMSAPLLEVRGLTKHFHLSRSTIDVARGVTPRAVHAVDDATLSVNKGDFLAVVGESGSGKTTLANCIVGFLEPTAGEITFDGRPVVEAGTLAHRTKPRRSIPRRDYSRMVQMVFQDPVSALNPRLSVGDAVAEAIRTNHLASGDRATQRMRDLFDLVKIPAGFERRYPHELNSGQRQRVVIARALSLEPRLLVADEPVAKLDVSMQGQVLNLLLDLQRDLSMTVLFITHDLSVVRQVATHVAVMYLGRIVEIAAVDPFFAAPAHPYSSALLSSTPTLVTDRRAKLFTISGEIPSPIDLPPGCRFSSRCPVRLPQCETEDPPLLALAADPARESACIRRNEIEWAAAFPHVRSEVSAR